MLRSTSGLGRNTFDVVNWEQFHGFESHTQYYIIE